MTIDPVLAAFALWGWWISLMTIRYEPELLCYLLPITVVLSYCALFYSPNLVHIWP